MKSYLIKNTIALTLIGFISFAIEATTSIVLGSLYTIILSFAFVALGLIPVWQKDQNHINLYYGYLAVIPFKFFFLGGAIFIITKFTQIDVISWIFVFFISYVCLQVIEIHHLLKSPKAV